MSYRNTDLKSTHHAMKVLYDGMKKAKAANEKREKSNADFLQAVRQRYPSGKYSEAYYTANIAPKLKAEVDAHNAEVTAEFIETMKDTAADMMQAAAVLQAGEDFRNQALDFSDTTLTNALRMLDSYPDMPAQEQANMLYQFRGDLPALRAIESKMAKNKMRGASLAHDLQKPIDAEMLEEIRRTAYQFSQGTYKAKSLESWYKSELETKAEAYGLDLNIDPYREAIAKAAEDQGEALRASIDGRLAARETVKNWEQKLRDMEQDGDREGAIRASKAAYDAVTSVGAGDVFD